MGSGGAKSLLGSIRLLIGTDPWARKVVSIGFSGTYTNDTAQHHGVALLGKQFTRLEVTFRLLKADQAD
jgi:hypothetical protein